MHYKNILQKLKNKQFYKNMMIKSIVTYSNLYNQPREQG